MVNSRTWKAHGVVAPDQRRRPCAPPAACSDCGKNPPFLWPYCWGDPGAGSWCWHPAGSSRALLFPKLGLQAPPPAGERHATSRRLWAPTSPGEAVPASTGPLRTPARCNTTAAGAMRPNSMSCYPQPPTLNAQRSSRPLSGQMLGGPNHKRGRQRLTKTYAHKWSALSRVIHVHTNSTNRNLQRGTSRPVILRLPRYGSTAQ